ncbi:unnamed protein product [Knipowitschia caucasica]
MKGLGGVNRNRHLSDCDPASSPAHQYQLQHHDALLYPASHPSSTLPRGPYPIMDRYPDQHTPLPNSSTFPGSPYSVYDGFSPPDSLQSAHLGSASVGMGMSGLRAPITSGSATISHHFSRSEAPQSLMELERSLPVGARDGFSTLQFHRSNASAAKQRESPGKIRYMLHSVSKLFNKAPNAEPQPGKSVNGRASGGSSSTEEVGKQSRRAKSRDRGKEKQRPRSNMSNMSNMSGYWSNDDLDSSDLSSYHHNRAMGELQGALHGGLQGGLQTLQSPQQRVLPGGYHTIGPSRSADMFSVGGQSGTLGVSDQDYVKGGSWCTLTMGQPRHLLQQGAHTLERSVLKSKSCNQQLSTNYLQVANTVRLLI